MKLLDFLRPRIGPMAVFWTALGFAGLGSASQFVYLVFGAVAGTALAGLLVWMWRERTRPVRNGIWFLLHLVFTAGLVLSAVSPIKGFVVAIPVALWWLHDAPASPTVMLWWGTLAVLWQPFEVWETSEDAAGVAWLVAMAMLMVIAAAQWERERLARRRDAPLPAMWMWARLGLVTLWTLIFILAREGLQAVSVFTALGIDLRGIAGRFAMLGIILVALALAGVLFRVRPQKSAPVAVPVAAAKPADEAGGKPAVSTRLDFDDAPEASPTPPARGKATPKAVARPAGKPAKPAAPAPQGVTAVRRPKAAAPAVQKKTEPAKPKASKRVDFD